MPHGPGKFPARVRPKSLPANSVPELIHFAKQHPGKLLYASPGVATSQHLFAELFKHTDQIAVIHEPTVSGVRIIETSKDAYVVKLLQAHAEVVSAFLANGMSEMMKSHPVPPR